MIEGDRPEVTRYSLNFSLLLVTTWIDFVHILFRSQCLPLVEEVHFSWTIDCAAVKRLKEEINEVQVKKTELIEGQ